MHGSWLALIEDVRSKGGYVGPVVCRDVPGSGRGLFLDEDVQASTRLLSIPPSALHNADTLRPIYPSGLITPSDGISSRSKYALNSTQALSMDIYLARKTPRPLVTPYLDTLPDSFDGHPLMWFLDDDGGKGNRELVESLPPSVRTLLDDLCLRCETDWTAVRAGLKRHKLLSPANDVDRIPPDFTWAWLCVNTRCLHYSLSSAHQDRSLKDIDLTLCPIVDFANHTVHPGSACEVNRLPCGALQLSSRGNGGMKKGDEVFLHYNSHSNASLFVEYGFVVPRVPRLRAEDEEDAGGEVNVDDLVLELFSSDKHKWRREILESAGYWLDWTLHASPPPAHPSYRLIPPLRLLHIQKPDRASLDDWEAMVLGDRELVSEGNERLARATLRQVCERLHHRGERELDGLKDSRPPDDNWVRGYGLGCLEILWKEERDVAEAVIQSIDLGHEF